MSNKAFEVNLFLLGAAKCGTTSLHYLLDQHPDICMANPKEPLFFEAEYEKGLEYYQRTYFTGCNAEPVIGESRTRNLFLPYVPGRIHETFPEAKFIVVLRNPVERAYSHWHHWSASGVEKLEFGEAVKQNLKWLDENSSLSMEEYIRLHMQTLDMKNGHSEYPSYVNSGYYVEQLERYIKIFGRERIHIVIFDDFVSDLEAELGKIYEFLGVEKIFPAKQKPRNMAVTPAGMFIISTLAKIRLRKLLPQRVRLEFLELLRRLYAKPTGSKEIDRQLKNQLALHYEPHIAALERLLGRELKQWRN